MVFESIISSFVSVPPWVSLVLLPALFLVYTAFIVVVGGRKSYPFVSVLGCILEAIFVSAYGATAAIFAVGLFALFALILRLLLLIPLPAAKRAARPEMRSERILQKVGRLQPGEAAVSRSSARVCAYEEAPTLLTAEASGMRLVHAEELLARLKRMTLSAADRLEADVLTRTLHGYCARLLTEEELVSLNDCLASVLKLSAKYKL